MRILLLPLLTLFYCLNAANYYISPSGDDANDGLSAVNAKATLNNLPPFNKGDTIFVETGEYLFDDGISLYGNGYVIQGRGMDSTIFKNIEGADNQFMQLQSDADSIHFNDLTFEGFQSDYGGAFMIGSKGIKFKRCLFKQNKAIQNTDGGGAIMTFDFASVELSSCVFRGNDAYYGSALYNAFDADMRIINCLFYEQKGSKGSVYNSNATANLEIINCTFAKNKNTVSDIYVNDGAAVIKNTIISDNAATNSLTVLTGAVMLSNNLFDAITSGNITENTSFLLAQAFFTDTAALDFSLTANSQAIDAGSPDGAPQFDILGHPRNGVPDIGAFEYQGSVSQYVHVGWNTSICIGDSIVIKGKQYFMPGSYLDTVTSYSDEDTIFYISIDSYPLPFNTFYNDAVGNTVCKDSAINFSGKGGVLQQYYVKRGPNITNVYESVGDSSTYTTDSLKNKDSVAVVTLSANGCETLSEIIEINVMPCNNPCPIMRANMKVNITADSIVLTDSSFGPKTNFAWVVDGEYLFNGAEVVLKDEIEPGFHQVCLTIFDSVSGCSSNEFCRIFEIESQQEEVSSCFAAFNYSVSEDTLRLNNTSYGVYDKVIWKIGQRFRHKNQVMEIMPVGFHEVCLSILDSATGCHSSVCKVIEIQAQDSDQVSCFADFNTYVDLASKTVTITNTSVGDVSAYFWQFGDGTYSYLKNPTHTFANYGYYNIKLVALDSATNCQSEITKAIDIADTGTVACKADFDYFISLEDKTIHLTNKSKGDFTNLRWNLGNGVFSNDSVIVQNYSQFGYKDICLMIYDSLLGCQDKYCAKIALLDTNRINCLADFEIYPNLETKEVEFINTSEGDFDRYFWRLGDGASADTISFTHQYDNFGYYDVSLTVQHAASQCVATVHKVIELPDTGAVGCLADFDFYTQDAEVSFSNTSKGSYSNFYWIFGDGSVSRQENPKHSYLKAGLYQVSLNIKDPSSGCQSSNTLQIEIIDTQTVYCGASFNYFPNQDNSVSFTALPTGSYTELCWSFGDYSYAEDSLVVHSYAQQGYYPVTLTVIDTVGGCMHTYTEEIAAGGTQALSNNCKAKFNYFPDDYGLIAFDNISQGEYENIFWSFGDGNNSSARESVSHNYSHGGYYEVNLTVVDTNTNCFDSYKEIISVVEDNTQEQDNCAAFFSYFISGDENVIKFADESYGNASKWYWDFGDGSSPSKGKNPAHRFRTDGYYQVCMTSVNASGCQDTYCEVIGVGDLTHACYADFNFFVAEDYAKFNNLSLGASLDYQWDFGDSVYSAQENPGHTYAQEGYYGVCLSASNDSGCVSINCKEVNIGSSLVDKCLFSCVWPGDANNDLEANHYDVLQIGLNYGQQGPKRDSVSNLYIGHSSSNWSTQQVDGTNNMHADCNGDGIINAKDTIAITQNFARSHYRQYRKNAEGAELSLVIEGDVVPGEPVSIDVIAGDDIVPLSMYGIGFELGFNDEEIDYSTVSVSWSDSWLDDESQELVVEDWGNEDIEEGEDLTVDDWGNQDIEEGEDLWADDWLDDEEDTSFLQYSALDEANSLLYVSGTRLDRRNVTGSGIIATVTYMIPSGFQGSELSLAVYTDGGVSVEGDDIEFTNDEIVVDVKKYIAKDFEYMDLLMYPNPTSGLINVYLSANEIHSLKVFDLMGRQVIYNQLSGGLQQIDLSALETGIYQVVISGQTYVGVKEIVLE